MNATIELNGTPNSKPPQSKTDLTLVIVDASNVAFGLDEGGRRARFRLLAHVMVQFPRASYEVKAVADASLRHRIDDKSSFEEYVREGFILQAPAGRSADSFIMQLAQSRRSRGQSVVLLSNDLFRQFPDFHAERIAFMAVGEREVIFDPPVKNSADHDTSTPDHPDEMPCISESFYVQPDSG